MAEYTVAISSEFFTAFSKLPKAKQNRVMEFVSKFSSNPMLPGLNLEKINGAADAKMYSARIDDTYRAIAVREENTFLLLWVDHHDEAYEWAARKKVAINQSTGAIQIYTAQTTETQPELQPEATAVFGNLSDDDLIALGVPDDLIPLVRSVYDEKGIYAVQHQLPSEVYSALDLVRDGCEVAEVIELLYSESKKGENNDIRSALNNPITQMQFTVVDGEEELKAMMNAPLEKWRVFLHPSQKKMVTKTFAGPARVLGGAGTGKTVVAMHRAKYLAQQCTGNQRILFTTFTANLAQDIRDNLRKICNAEEMRRIEIIHLDAWITRYLRNQEYDYTIVYDDDGLADMWQEARMLTGEDFEFGDDFFKDEWESIVQAQGITTMAQYAQASRPGRGIRLSRKQRIAVWKVFEEYKTLMNKKKYRDVATAMNECCELLRSQPDYCPYTSIIVDEGQDFGMGAYRLLRALAGNERSNDLFIVGDAHQRIYRNKVTLSKCGIHVRGRSSQLKVNYRTTEEIRGWAMHVLKDIPFDDLDGGMDNAKGYRSLSHGDNPTVEPFNDATAEMAALISKIKEKLALGMDEREICVVARTNKMISEYVAGLQEAGIKIYEIKRSKTDDRQMPGIRIATMHRVKGLEFSCVFLVGMNHNVMPLKSAISSSDPSIKEEAMNSERCLLYVALTRAKKAAYVSGYGKISDFVAQNLQQ